MSDIAVVIPAHDAEAYLGDALRSLKSQTLAPSEVVVVDDGSRDGTAKVAVREGVRCVRQEQAGPAAARNRGVRETTAPLIAFLDADDWFLPEKLARQAALMQDTGAPASCTDAFSVRNGERAGIKNRRRTVRAFIAFEDLLVDNPMICSTVVVRRDAFDRAGGFDEDSVLVATEDYDLWLRVARQAPIAYLDEPLVCYREHGSGLSDNRRFLRGIDHIMDKVIAAAGDEDVRRRADRRRALVRLDLAWDRIRDGARAEARELVREARSLGATPGRCLHMLLRSYLPRLRRSGHRVGVGGETVGR